MRVKLIFFGLIQKRLEMTQCRLDLMIYYASSESHYLIQFMDVDFILILFSINKKKTKQVNPS